MPHRVVIIGGGFAGLNAARALNDPSIQIILLDRRNFHLFQPLLYQVATGTLSPADIAAPLRWILRDQKNTEVLLGEVIEIDVAARLVKTSFSHHPYDSLIVATGARHHYFGNPEWEAFAPGLKTIEDATEIRRRILTAFEMAERETDPVKRREWLTFLIIGGGPTGVELAGALGEIANDILEGDFRNCKPEESRILLLDAADRLLGAFSPKLSAAAEYELIQLVVRTRLKMTVDSIDSGGITVKTADGSERMTARTILWAAGVQASGLARIIAQQTGVECDRAGRIFVDVFANPAGHPEIFVLGDMTHFKGDDGQPLPGVAPVAMQQGAWVGATIRNRLSRKPTKPFHYRDKGSMAVIGRGSAIAKIGSWENSGWLAWLMWLFIHLMYIVGFRSRLAVLSEWAYAYLTFHRSARLITNERSVDK